VISDNELMLKVKSGDIDRLGLIYERYNKSLFGYFINLTNRIDISEDLVQNVFMRILQYRSKYKGNGHFNVWIYKIAHNVFIDFVKRKKRLEFSENMNEWANVMSESAFDENMSRKEEINILKMALLKLPGKQREIITLSRYHELKYKEIAEIVGCSEGAVKVRIFRALDELKTIYKKFSKD